VNQPGAHTALAGGRSGRVSRHERGHQEETDWCTKIGALCAELAPPAPITHVVELDRAGGRWRLPMPSVRLQAWENSSMRSPSEGPSIEKRYHLLPSVARRLFKEARGVWDEAP